MSTKENKEYVRQIFKLWNEFDADRSKIRPFYERYFSPNYVVHGLSRGDMNLEQAIQYVVLAMSAFPDINYSIDDMVAEGDKVATRYVMKATHKGMFMGIPATGKQVIEKGVEIRTIKGGKSVEVWDFPDSLSLITQLGLAPGDIPKK